MASLFDKLESEAFRKGLTARSKEAETWFKKNVKKLGKLGPNILKDERLTKVSPVRPGDMVMYTYNPKLRQTLPYYDTFPLTIVIGKAPGGFFGLNLHYLPPKIRAIFLDKLDDVVNNQKFDKTTRFKVTYKMLTAAAKYKYFKPCFKHYLTKHVTSNVMKISAAEWNIAIFLETAAFRKKSTRYIWGQSRRMY
tara:strand:+ start:322 stop:903 length:582 start_codon:yes stop_codon:yes gene_type:complete